MEFLKIVKRRSFISEVVYIGLNIALAIAILIAVRVTPGFIWPALVLVLLSKWRVLAVRMRFWFANIQADLVSLIVSVGYVIFLYYMNLALIPETQILITQLLLMFAYIVWLLFIRPQSKRKYIVFQAGLALFVGITAIFAMTYNWFATPIVLLVWLVGYATARHMLSSYDEDHIAFLSLAWGLVIAEIGWLAYHWTVAYRVPIADGILLPQVSLIILCIGFLAYKSYDSYYHHKKIRMNDIILPLLFNIGIIALLIFAFNGVNTI